MLCRYVYLSIKSRSLLITPGSETDGKTEDRSRAVRRDCDHRHTGGGRAWWVRVAGTGEPEARKRHCGAVAVEFGQTGN